MYLKLEVQREHNGLGVAGVDSNSHSHHGDVFRIDYLGAFVIIAYM